MNQVIITEYSVMKHVFGELEPVAIFYIIYCYVFLSPSCVLRCLSSVLSLQKIRPVVILLTAKESMSKVPLKVILRHDQITESNVGYRHTNYYKS